MCSPDMTKDPQFATADPLQPLYFADQETEA